MSNNESPADPMANASREDVLSALFANLVIQQTNMAFMFLGRVPHPETGEVVKDLESAKFFIDQLDMIEAKTKGNLDKREEGLLKQSLTGLRMAFVEAVGQKDEPVSPQPKTAAAVSGGVPSQPDLAPVSEAAAPKTEAAADEESRKKFSKKY